MDMSLSKSVLFFKNLNKEVDSLGLQLFCDDDKFIVSNCRGDGYEDNIYFSCNTLEELNSFLRGLEAGKLLTKFYSKRFDTWSGNLNKKHKFHE